MTITQPTSRPPTFNEIISQLETSTTVAVTAGAETAHVELWNRRNGRDNDSETLPGSGDKHSALWSCVCGSLRSNEQNRTLTQV